jgi:MATE family multidrug resistance protein
MRKQCLVLKDHANFTIIWRQVNQSRVIDLMTTSPDVRTAAKQYTLWAALTPLAAVAAYELDGIFIGATWSREMRNLMVLSSAIFVPASIILIPTWHNHGL